MNSSTLMLINLTRKQSLARLAKTAIAGGIALLLALSAQTAFSAQPKTSKPNSTTQRRTFFRWGQGQNEAQLDEGPEREHKGFTSFALDGPDSVLVLDSVRHCVQRVDLTSGTLTVAARGVGGAAICPSRKGGFHLLDGAKVRRMDAKAAAKSLAAGAANSKTAASTSSTEDNVAVPSEEGYGIELFSDASGDIWLQGLDQTCRLVSSASASAAIASKNVAAPKVIPGRPATLPGSSEPLYFRIKRLDGGRIRLLGFDAAEKDVVSVDISLDGGRAGSVFFKGADSDGRLYVEVERIEDNGAVGLEVHRYSPQGRRLAVFSLPNTYSTTIYKKTEVAPNGSVVQMLSSRKGVEFLEYGP